VALERKSHSVFDKIEDAYILKSDRQKGIDRSDDYRQKQSSLRERKNRNKQANGNDTDVTKLPQP
jgi:hypothetical protein